MSTPPNLQTVSVSTSQAVGDPNGHDDVVGVSSQISARNRIENGVELRLADIQRDQGTNVVGNSSSNQYAADTPTNATI